MWERVRRKGRGEDGVRGNREKSSGGWERGETGRTRGKQEEQKEREEEGETEKGTRHVSQRTKVTEMVHTDAVRLFLHFSLFLLVLAKKIKTNVHPLSVFLQTLSICYRSRQEIVRHQFLNRSRFKPQRGKVILTT